MASKKKLEIICAVLICVAGVLWMATTRQSALDTLTYSQFLEQVRIGKVASVIVTGSNSGAVQAICHLKRGKPMRTVLSSDYRDAVMAMQDKSVNLEIRDASSGPFCVFANAMPVFLLLGVWIFLMVRGFLKHRTSRTSA